MQPSPECSERRALWERYHASLRAYIGATEILDSNRFGPEFDHAYNQAMWARLEFEALREEYRRHIAEHGCV